ncbi:MAG TPA: hypothetical protein VN812_20155 [Candidatus Acidoferrales bacterium]|nr:hypothetical protein [Candidatus Acidoferrales bacterium]
MAAVADVERSSPPPDASSGVDLREWTVIKSLTANLGAQLPHATVLLLKSVAEPGRKGGVAPIPCVNLIVVAGERILYHYVPLAVPAPDDERPDSIFYWSDELELRDVTGDGVPEIVFDSQIQQGMSSMSIDIHVLQYQPAKSGPGTFRDIRRSNFVASEWIAFNWLDFKGQTLAILADPVDAPVPPGVDEDTALDMHCHECARLRRYLVYQWDSKPRRFILRRIIPPSGALHSIDGGWWEDGYIVKNLKRHPL